MPGVAMEGAIFAPPSLWLLQPRSGPSSFVSQVASV